MKKKGIKWGPVNIKQKYEKKDSEKDKDKRLKRKK